ncbi:hypothetical protein Nepgr_030745 [Nepenthes gracilis]|uniref:Uncharacterized protein n=1 Tax=Nepenthes gracilis TaxID=150966 RepID=A0AAD3Y440_NEPGR|nr:hypothetical protein Nepgr_030745 [Nepenthes gracilis]
MESMDLSSLSDEQRQQLEQLQQSFEEHQRQQQEQQLQQQQQQMQQYQNEQQQQQMLQQYQQQYPAYAYQYDLAQAQANVGSSQAYDQPTEAYYQSYYQQEQQQQRAEGQVQNYDYSQQHQQSQPLPLVPQPTVAQAEAQPDGASQPGEPQPVPVQQPGISIIGEKMAQVGAGAVLGSSAESHQQTSAYPGLSPQAAAAVAALSQLADFAGTMGVAERAIAGLQLHGKGGGNEPMMSPHGSFPGPLRPLVNQPTYGGSIGIGVNSFRGRRGGHRGTFGGRRFLSSSSRGRGRGRGQSKDGQGQPAQDGQPLVSDPPSSVTEEAETSAVVSEAPHQDGVLPAAVPRKAASDRKPPQILRCDICNVECNSVEILEQHKTGKKHKKNLQKLEELKNGGNIPSEATASQSKTEAEQQTDVVATQQENSTANVPEEQNKRPDMKRKMTSSHGAKRLRMEPWQPRIVVPLLCDLCNIKCDTQEVFNRHLAGKKHIAKVKRYEGHQAMYGPAGLQALYPPNPISQNFLHPQAQGSQDGLYGPWNSYPQQAAFAAHHGDPAAAIYFGQFHQNSNPQG